jgi:hypothetical protein
MTTGEGEVKLRDMRPELIYRLRMAKAERDCVKCSIKEVEQYISNLNQVLTIEDQRILLEFIQ